MKARLATCFHATVAARGPRERNVLPKARQPHQWTITAHVPEPGTRRVLATDVLTLQRSTALSRRRTVVPPARCHRARWSGWRGNFAIWRTSIEPCPRGTNTAWQRSWALGLEYSPCFRRCERFPNMLTQFQPICSVSSRNFASARRLAKEGSRVSSMRSGLCSR